METILNKIKFIFWDKYFYQITFLFALSVIILGFVLSKRDTETINQNTKFTVATIISDWHHKNNNGFGVDYEYYVNEMRYQKTRNLNLKKGQKFLLAFDSLNPRRSHLLEEYELYSKISLKPESKGWNYNQIPFQIDSVRVKKQIEATNAFTIFKK